MKRFLSLFLALAMCFSLTAPAFAEAGVKEPQMVDIELTITDDYGIIVSVPEDKAEEYRQRLENDPEFRQSEIDIALMFANPGIASRAYPEGRVCFERYMCKDDIRKAVDTWSGISTFDTFMGSIPTALTIADTFHIIELSGFADAVSLGASILSFIIGLGASYQNNWWLEAERDICDGKITAVRYALIESTVEYPKAWRVFERV